MVSWKAIHQMQQKLDKLIADKPRSKGREKGKGKGADNEQELWLCSTCENVNLPYHKWCSSLKRLRTTTEVGTNKEVKDLKAMLQKSQAQVSTLLQQAKKESPTPEATTPVSNKKVVWTCAVPTCQATHHNNECFK